MKKQITTFALASTLSMTVSNAASVFFDTFDHGGDLVIDGGWTTHNGGNLVGNGAGILNGQGDNADGNWAEWNYTTTLAAGDILTIDANVDRGNTPAQGYGYITNIYLWDGTNPGTVQLASGTTQFPAGPHDAGPIPLVTESYTVTAADITAGRDQVIFRYGHGGGSWGESHDVDFGVTPVPEPSSSALLALAGLGLFIRRR